MNYLLDTHTLLWTLFSTKNLSPVARETISDPHNGIFVSPVSFWEISLKYSMGKIILENVLPDDLPGYAEESGFDVIDITTKEAASFYRLPRVTHKDPFDRLIVWQAIQRNMILLSRDRGLDEYKSFGLKRIW